VAAPQGIPSPASAFPVRESAPPSSGFTAAPRVPVPRAVVAAASDGSVWNHTAADILPHDRQ
jgi:hypothetical protein